MISHLEKRVGVVRFPGTNCDRDVYGWAEAKKYQVDYLWYQDRFEIKSYDLVIIPGGFSFGDYLRSGALAARSPVMDSVRELAKSGREVLGICNGFQILCEAQLLPGVLVKNHTRRFIDKIVEVVVKNPRRDYSEKAGQKFNLPIAHGDGRFYAPPETLKSIHGEGLVWLQYEDCPNGSIDRIAGLFNKEKNIYGLMPHPERALYSWMNHSVVADGQFHLCGWDFI